jgi:RHS repeat-associated protein
LTKGSNETTTTIASTAPSPGGDIISEQGGAIISETRGGFVGIGSHSLAITVGYSYDDLGRVTHVAYPGGGAFDQPVDYVYDNLGRVKSATDAGTHSATFVYDALGNVTSQGDALSSRTMLYDADGRRIRLTWSDTRYVTYEYDSASDLTAIKEGGTTALATFEYDDVGRRHKLTRGNGVVTTYGYDVLGLTSLVNDLAGTAYDQTLGFTHNPAGQIAQKTSSNDAYAWTGHYNVNRAYTSNGLNQYTASGSVTPTYDEKANLASAGGATYAYSTKNELVSTSDTGTQFYHDPLGRLDSVLGAPSGNTGFQYDGDKISTEYTGTSPYPLLRRYVYGPGDDEPLVWYEGADFSNNRYLVADERGSVTAVTDGSGNPIQINSYDEYGIPASTNLGRFQYTGQAWIPEIGMYSYKARIYSPTLGRFLQPDPIGYPDGPNNYNYVLSDPVNGTDPSGYRKQGGSDGGEVYPDLPEITVTGTRDSVAIANVGAFGRSRGGGGVGGSGGGGSSAADQPQSVKPCSGGGNSSSPPASYAAPSGSRPYTPDGRIIRAANGSLQINPAYQAQINSFRPNTRGILGDFFSIAKGIVTSFAIGGTESEIGDLLGLSEGQKSAVDAAQGIKDSKDAAKDTREEMNKCGPE